MGIIEVLGKRRMGAKLFSAEKFRWLFAETLVIVLGVLIALGLDDYRTDLYERGLAIDYVQRIENDINRDLEFIAAVWYPGLKTKREALQFVAPIIRGESPVPDDTTKFLKNVSLGGVGGTSAVGWYTDTTFQDMRATGNLRLIQDPAIRAEISEYYEVMEFEALRVERRFTRYVSFVHSVMPSELRDDIDSDSLERFGVDYALKRLLSDEFRNLVNQEYNLLLFMEDREYEEFARSLLEELGAYRASFEGD